MKKIKKLKIRRKRHRAINKGEAGAMFILAFLILIFVLGFSFIGGQLPRSKADKTGTPVAIITEAPQQAKKNLQLYTFTGATLTPSPIPSYPPAVEAAGCSQSQFNTEDEILIGSDPAPGAVTSSLIRVWVTDELANRISPNEVVDPGTGQITTAGDRTALDTDSDGRGKFLWEPALYITPASAQVPTAPFCDATKAECIPHFPDIIKGDYNSNPDFFMMRSDTKGPAVDADWENFKNGPAYTGSRAAFFGGMGMPYIAEYIWDVTKLGLSAGNYWAQFVIHDGDTNLGISCITIQIK